MRRMYQENSGTSNQQGFTLVELAIVMTIIGLLIGGVLKGQEMINNARITSTIAQVQAYKAAIYTFRDRFDQFPGDMPVATYRLPSCTADNFCYNGNGNGIIGNLIGGWGWAGDGDATVESENTQFWKHLALADLISGVNPASSVPAWGKTHPASKFAGGFFALTISQAGGRNGMQVRMQPAVTGSYGSDAGSNSIAPRDAAIIDRKMDDGKPDTGSVTAYGSGHLNCTSSYDETVSLKNCIMGFTM